MKLLFIRLEIVLFLSFGGSFSLFAQFVRNDRMFSFEESEVPACMSSENSKLSISTEHYKDGKHSLAWSFESGGILSLKKDLKFEKMPGDS